MIHSCYKQKYKEYQNDYSEEDEIEIDSEIAVLKADLLASQGIGHVLAILAIFIGAACIYAKVNIMGTIIFDCVILVIVLVGITISYTFKQLKLSALEDLKSKKNSNYI